MRQGLGNREKARMSELHQLWRLSDEALRSARPQVDYLVESCPQMLGFQMYRLIALAKVSLPFMTTVEADLLVDYLRGFAVPDADKVPSGDISAMIAEQIRETFPVDFGHENLAQEMKESGQDPEWQARYRKMPANLFADRVEETFDPLQAYLLIVMVECYWQRKISHEDAALADYFNICDP